MPNHNMGGKDRRRRKQRLVERDGHRCHYCHQAFALHDLTFEHLIPHGCGGSNALENLVLACFVCNNRRGSGL